MGEARSYSRRELLAASLLGVAGTVLLAGCSATREGPPPQTSAYLPVWLDAAGYKRIETTLAPRLTSFSRVYLAFATPDAKGGLTKFVIPDGAAELIQRHMLATANVSLSVGGASVSTEAWQAAAAKPEAFGVAVEAARLATEKSLLRPVHVDLDCEASLPTANITSLAHAVHAALPDGRELTMAVPAENHDNFDTGPNALGAVVTRYEVMTYDEVAPDGAQSIAGPMSNGPWVVRSIAAWKDKVGDASKLALGFSVEAHAYVGARAFGDPASAGSSILAADIPAAAVRRDDFTQQTSTATSGSTLYAYTSPPVAHNITTMVHNAFPEIGGAFYWSMAGLDPTYVDAVQSAL